MTLIQRIAANTLPPMLLIGAMMASIAGCKVGPDFAPPVVNIPEVWNQELPENAELAPQNELIDTSWWTVFQDPTLDRLVYEAANSNLDLRQTGSRIMEARFARGVIAGGLFPAVESRTAYTRNQISTNGNPFGFTSGSLPNFPGFAPFDLFSTGFDASWELDLFGQVRRSVEAADAEVGVAVEDHRAMAVSLFAEVASNYVDLRTIQEQIKIAADNARVQEETEKLTKDRFNAGNTTILEVSQATSILRNTQATIPSLQSQLRAVMHRLCVLRAEFPHDLGPELGAAPIPKAPSEIQLNLPVSLIRQRPDVRRAERQIAAQTARVGVAVADLYPDVSLLGTFNWEAVDAANLFEGGSVSYRLTGPSIRWKIVQFGRIRNNIRVQDSRLEQAMLRYETTVLRSLEEVETALNAYVELQQRLKLLDQADEAATQAEELARTRWSEGAESYQTVLDAQKFRLVVQEQRVSTRGNVAQRLISLYRALGGGWQFQAMTGMSMENGTADQPAPDGETETVPTPDTNSEST